MHPGYWRKTFPKYVKQIMCLVSLPENQMRTEAWLPWCNSAATRLSWQVSGRHRDAGQVDLDSQWALEMGGMAGENFLGLNPFQGGF